MVLKYTPLTSRRFIIFTRHESIWAGVAMGPPDANLGITEAFHACKNPKKLNLGVGTYLDDRGKRFVFPCVRKAEKLIVASSDCKQALPLLGTDAFRKLTLQLALGTDNDLLKHNLVATTQSIAGTGALKIGSELIKRFYPGIKKIYLPVPTWINHERIMTISGLEVGKYRYYDYNSKGLDFEGLKEDISNIPEQSIILFQVSAHNPTGVDPSNSQWDELSAVVKSRNLLPFFDMAYQGFATGSSDKDAYSVRKFIKDGHYILLAQSYAKNLGLYGERVGTISATTANKTETNRIIGQFKTIVRSSYSTPPIHGALIVTKILQDPALKADWLTDFKRMAQRIHEMRQLLKLNLQALGSQLPWDHVTNQYGMYCYTGLTESQVQKLADTFGIFLTKYGRLNIAGLIKPNVEYVAAAIHNVTK